MSSDDYRKGYRRALVDATLASCDEHLGDVWENLSGLWDRQGLVVPWNADEPGPDREALRTMGGRRFYEMEPLDAQERLELHPAAVLAIKMAIKPLVELARGLSRSGRLGLAQALRQVADESERLAGPPAGGEGA